MFKDVDSIGIGDFRGAIAEAVNQSDVLLIIIGKQWAAIKDEYGNLRLNNAGDFVRLEIQAGLQRRGRCWIVPVTVGGAPFPDANQLPPDLRELSFQNAFVVRDDPDFHRDVDRLIDKLKWQFRNRYATGEVKPPQPQTSPGMRRPKQGNDNSLLLWGIVLLVVVAILVVIGILLSGGGDGDASDTTTPTTAVAEVATHTTEPTLTDAPEPTMTPTDLSIAFIVGTLDAQATDVQATAYAEETIAARLTDYAMQTQQSIDATATATQWTDTPTPDITASIEAFRTEQAETATQAWVDSWTNTPTSTATILETVTPLETLPELLIIMRDESGNPARFNCMLFVETYETIYEQVEINNPDFEDARELFQSRSPARNIYEEFCVDARDDTAVFIAKTYYIIDIRAFIDDILLKIE